MCVINIQRFKYRHRSIDRGEPTFFGIRFLNESVTNPRPIRAYSRNQSLYLIFSKRKLPAVFTSRYSKR